MYCTQRPILLSQIWMQYSGLASTEAFSNFGSLCWPFELEDDAKELIMLLLPSYSETISPCIVRFGGVFLFFCNSVPAVHLHGIGHDQNC